MILRRRILSVQEQEKAAMIIQGMRKEFLQKNCDHILYYNILLLSIIKRNKQGVS